jgi:hypothetical protein
MLAQEPWCFHPEQIAGLTDCQIEQLYARPAVERAERMEAEREGRTLIKMPGVPTMPKAPSNSDSPSDINSPELREYIIGQYTGFGMSRSAAEARYEKELADWKNPDGSGQGE